MKRMIIIAALLAASAAHAQNYKNIWDDVRKPWRANSEMDAAVQANSGHAMPKWANCRCGDAGLQSVHVASRLEVRSRQQVCRGAAVAFNGDLQS